MSNSALEQALAAPPEGEPDITHLKVLANRIATSYVNRRLTPNMRKAVIAYTLGVGAWGIGKAWYERGLTYINYTITIESDDEIYDEVHEWMLKNIPQKRQRSLIAMSMSERERREANTWYPDDEPDIPGGHTKRTRALRFFYDGDRAATIKLNGHKVQVSVEKPERQAMDPSRPFMAVNQNDVITFTVYGTKARDAVVALLDEISERVNATAPQRPKFYMTTKWGDWSRQSDVPLRTLDSLVLQEGQLDEIIADLKNFLDREEKYAALGIPYHRGYILYGPPGTGKTSMAKALAEHFDMDLYYMHLSGMDKDASLMSLINGVTARSLCLIEDIDRLSVAQEDDTSDDGLTMSGLLNALDGVGTPQGVVFLLTTNHIERIDPAVLRPGRIDLPLHIDFADTTQVNTILERAYGRKFNFEPDTFEGLEISPADIVGFIKKNFDDSDKAEAGVRKLVKKKRRKLGK